MYGYEGVKTLYKTIEYAKSKGLYVIVDGKRNDIGATMEAYTNAYLGTTSVNSNVVEAFGADSLTVNGYLGTDGISPLIKACNEYDKSIFVLVKTSNNVITSYSIHYTKLYEVDFPFPYYYSE